MLLLFIFIDEVDFDKVCSQKYTMLLRVRFKIAKFTLNLEAIRLERLSNPEMGQIEPYVQV